MGAVWKLPTTHLNMASIQVGGLELSFEIGGVRGTGESMGPQE